VHAHGEAAALAERALKLWSRVPEPESVAGIDHVELYRRAAMDTGADGDLARMEQLLLKGLKLIDEKQEPQRAAKLIEPLCRAQWQLNRSGEAIESAERALNLLADIGPTAERARILGWMAKARMLQGKYVQSLEVADEAIEVSHAVGSWIGESRARNARGIALVALGQVEEGEAELRRSLEIALERENVLEMGSAYANLADALNAAGRTRQALDVVEEGQRVINAHARSTTWLGTMIAEFSWQLGDWGTAERWMPSSNRRQVGTELMYTLIIRINMALGRGEHAAARQYVDAISEHVAESSEPQFLAAWGAMSAILDLREGDIESARAAVDEALDRIEFCTEDASRIVRLSAVGVAIEADAAQRARDLGDDPGPALARAEIMLARVRAAAEGDVSPVDRAWLAMAEAESRRAEGNSVPELWFAAAAEWDKLEWPYERALARWREAEAHAAAGDREAAAAAAGAALDTARRLGAAWLRGEVEGLAARARLPLGSVEEEIAVEEPAAVEEEDPFGLTPRERQVLALVAEGRTNREIGDTLYMAEKTASVHVSRILSKLDVRSRTEAAAVAHRLGLDAGDLRR
jgi:ATP/maltotriose-dependent transcriptional regulator MalT